MDEICGKLINEKLALKGQHLRCFNYSVTSCCSRCTVSLEIYQWTDSNAESTNVVYVVDKPLNNYVHPQYTTRRAKWRTGKASNCPKIIVSLGFVPCSCPTNSLGRSYTREASSVFLLLSPNLKTTRSLRKRRLRPNSSFLFICRRT